MSDLSASEQPRDNDVEASFKSIIHRIHPHAALPEHLQAIDFDQDIWARVRRHPIRNPTLSRNKLDEDPESRELVRQVMSAASEREKEVLLHNQARVFQEVLGRVLDQIWGFLDRPMLPARMIPETTRSLPSSPGPLPPGSLPTSSLDPPDETAKSSAQRAKWQVGWTGLVVALITPKYILLILTAFFLFTTGYSQMQLKNLNDSINSYKVAAEASEDLKNELSQAVASAKRDREDLNASLDGKILEIAQVRNQLREEQQKIAGLQSQLKAAEERGSSTASELARYREQQADDIKAVQGKNDALQADILSTTAQLATATARASSLEETIASLRRTNSDQQQQLRTKTSDYESLAQVNSSLLNQVSDLQKHKALLGFAETCIDNIQRSESWREFNHNSVRQYLAEFKSAKKNLGFR